MFKYSRSYTKRVERRIPKLEVAEHNLHAEEEEMMFFGEEIEEDR